MSWTYFRLYFLCSILICWIECYLFLVFSMILPIPWLVKPNSFGVVNLYIVVFRIGYSACNRKQLSSFTANPTSDTIFHWSYCWKMHYMRRVAEATQRRRAKLNYFYSNCRPIHVNAEIHSGTDIAYNHHYNQPYFSFYKTVSLAILSICACFDLHIYKLN